MLLYVQRHSERKEAKGSKSGTKSRKHDSHTESGSQAAHRTKNTPGKQPGSGKKAVHILVNAVLTCGHGVKCLNGNLWQYMTSGSAFMEYRCLGYISICYAEIQTGTGTVDNSGRLFKISVCVTLGVNFQQIKKYV